MHLKSMVPFRERGGRARPDMFGNLQQEIDRLFDDFSRGFGAMGMMRMPGGMAMMPNIDVAETDKEFEITAELPGLEQKDVDISLADNVLTIRGEKKTEHEEKDKGKNYYMSERTYGAFHRALELPPGVDPKAIKATMSKGVLKIMVPKPARTEAQKIPVKEAA